MKRTKRLLDLFLVVSSAPIWLALLVSVGLMIAVKLGRPVFFCQRRAGFQGKPFNIIKFRTMTSETDQDGNLLPDEKRLNAFGKWLRATSLDEFPELINVLRGDMSLVGPRPLHCHYNERYDSFQRRRLQAVPGVTGWAQVNGRNAVSWSERFRFDVWYVDNQTTFLDLKILWLTFFKVFKREGITSSNSATMEEFMGNVREPQNVKPSDAL